MEASDYPQPPHIEQPAVPSDAAINQPVFTAYEQRVARNGVKRLYGIDERGKKHQFAVKNLLGLYGYTLAESLQKPPASYEQLHLAMDVAPAHLVSEEPVDTTVVHEPVQEAAVAPLSSKIMSGVFLGLRGRFKHDQAATQQVLVDQNSKPVFNFESPLTPVRAYAAWHPSMGPLNDKTTVRANNPVLTQPKPSVGNWWEDEKSLPLLTLVKSSEGQKPVVADSEPPKGSVIIPPTAADKNDADAPPKDDAPIAYTSTDSGSQITDTEPTVSGGVVSDPLTPAKLQDYLDAAAAYRMAQQQDPRAQGRGVADVDVQDDVVTQSDTFLPPDPDTRVIDPWLIPSDVPYISLSQRFREWRYNRAQSRSEQRPRRRRAGFILAGLVGAAVLVGLLARDTDDKPERASVTTVAPVQPTSGTVSTPENTVITVTPTSVPESSVPVPSIPPGADTTIPHIPPLETVPAPPTIPAQEPVTVIPAEVPPTSPVVVTVPETPPPAPVAEQPAPMPVTPVIGEAVSFSPSAMPSTNAEALGVDRPNAFIQAVLNEYSRRFARAFIWHHDDGMFYEGRHIISPPQLKDFNKVMLDVYAYIFYNTTH